MIIIMTSLVTMVSKHLSIPSRPFLFDFSDRFDKQNRGYLVVDQQRKSPWQLQFKASFSALFGAFYQVSE